jgi:hypothetical protein
MKIALCLSGEPRDFQFNWADLFKKLNHKNIENVEINPVYQYFHRISHNKVTKTLK